MTMGFNETIEKYKLDYIIPLIIWIAIFGKNVFSSLMFVDYAPSVFFDSIKNLVSGNFTYMPLLFEIPKFIFSIFGLLYNYFTIIFLVFMLFSYFYIKKLLKGKSQLFVFLFSFIFFFNSFVYSRIMVGQIGIIFSYFMMPMFLYYSILLFKHLGYKNLIKAVIAFAVSSSLAMHFLAINLGLFLLVSFWFYIYKNEKRDWRKYFIVISIFIILSIFLNAYAFQGLLSNPIFSSINSQHESFFAPKLSQDIPAIAKLIGLEGFWREIGYKTLYKSIPPLVYYSILAILILLMIQGYYSYNEKESKNFFYSLFWIGLILGTGISHPYTKPIFDFLFNHLPLFNGFRDSHKFAALIALSYSYLIPLGIISIKQNISGNITKQKLRKIVSFIFILLSIAFLVFSSFPLIGLSNQAHSVKYPQSYIQAGNFIDNSNMSLTENRIIYIPFYMYLTYNWSTPANSDGRIPAPINAITKTHILVGIDEYGGANLEQIEIIKCLSNKSIPCLENNSIEYIIKDKCTLTSLDYSWVNETNTETIYSGECINIYKTNPSSQRMKTKGIPIRFILGSIISLITLIILITYLLKNKEKQGDISQINMQRELSIV